jgi:hypothetical protein
MNSPLENRKVRLRGLGGPAVQGIPGTGASATGDFRRTIGRKQKASPTEGGFSSWSARIRGGNAVDR